MTDRVLEQRGNDQYVEYTDDFGIIRQGWKYGTAEQKCACGKQNINNCREIRVTTFSESYECGYVYRYANRNGHDDNLIK